MGARTARWRTAVELIFFFKRLKFMIVQFEWQLHVYFMLVLCGLIFQICALAFIFSKLETVLRRHCEVAVLD